MIKATLVNIDAWNDGEGWCWNNQFRLTNVEFENEDCFNARPILKWMREHYYLTESSKGKIRVDDTCWPIVEIQNRRNLQPLYAFLVEEEHDNE